MKGRDDLVPVSDEDRNSGVLPCPQQQRLRLQERLEDAALVTRRLAHDYGNVLTGILGFTELILTHLPAESPIRTYLTEVYRAAQQGAQLTAQLRLYCRRTWPTSQPSWLNQTLTGEEERLRTQFGPNLHLEVILPGNLPAVALESEALRLALRPVLDNAVEAVTGGGTVQVSACCRNLSDDDCKGIFGTAVPGWYVAVTIADEGCGLSAEARERLFTEPFFTTKAHHRGLGLGVTYGILRCHQGGLTLEPRSPRGTVVQLYLPAASAPAPSSLPPTNQNTSQRVLVVDDDPMILQLVGTTLKRAGYQVETATSAAEALKCFGKEGGKPFRLVLSDVAMPRMDGLELAYRLQTQDVGVNILFMSGQMVGDLASQDFCGRKFDLLIKPFRPDGLLQAVRSAMERTGQEIAPRSKTVDNVIS